MPGDPPQQSSARRPAGGGLALHVGTYDKAGGAGLTPLSHTAEHGWAAGETYAGAKNASFGVYSSRFDLWYFVDERADGAIGVFRYGDTGWEQLGRISSGGDEPCYLALSGDQSLLAAANYGSGAIALYRLDEASGLPLDPPSIRANRGSGPVADRQDGPHAHCVRFSPDGQWLYHVDLGTDEVLAHSLDGKGGLGDVRLAYRAPPGSGPRHLLFHPQRQIALLVSELASTLTLLEVGGGSLSAVTHRSTLPDDFEGDSLGGHLALNRAGDRAYVTNRGHDSVAVFAVQPSGDLQPLQHVPSGGASPRALLLIESERLLVLANEAGDNVTMFRVGEQGLLTPMGIDLAIAGAAFVIDAEGDAAAPA